MTRLCNLFNDEEHSSSASSSSCLAVPEEFLCPITQSIMIDPLMCRSGLSYDRSAILEWISEHNATCPMTRQPLKASNLVPNNALKKRIQEWCRANDYEPEREESVDKHASFVAITLDPRLNQKIKPPSAASQRRIPLFTLSAIVQR